MLFNVDIVNLLLKDNRGGGGGGGGGDTERLILFSWFEVLWLSVSRWWRLGAESLI